MHIDGHGGGLQFRGVVTRGRLLPRLRRADEHLKAIGSYLFRLLEWRVAVDVGSEDHLDTLIRSRGGPRNLVRGLSQALQQLALHLHETASEEERKDGAERASGKVALETMREA